MNSLCFLIFTETTFWSIDLNYFTFFWNTRNFLIRKRGFTRTWQPSNSVPETNPLTVVKCCVFWTRRSLESEIARSVVRGNYWGCQDFWYRVVIIPSWQRDTCATETTMLRLVVRLRPSVGLSRPSVLSASGRPRTTTPVTCHPKGLHSSASFRARTLCHSNRFYYGVTSKPSLLPQWNQSKGFRLNPRFYSLPPHQKVTLTLVVVANVNWRHYRGVSVMLPWSTSCNSKTKKSLFTLSLWDLVTSIRD